MHELGDPSSIPRVSDKAIPTSNNNDTCSTYITVRVHYSGAERRGASASNPFFF